MAYALFLREHKAEFPFRGKSYKAPKYSAKKFSFTTCLRRHRKLLWSLWLLVINLLVFVAQTEPQVQNIWPSCSISAAGLMCIHTQKYQIQVSWHVTFRKTYQYFPYDGGYATCILYTDITPNISKSTRQYSSETEWMYLIFKSPLVICGWGHLSIH